MPYRKCSFCSNNNKVKKEANYFKLSKHILQSLGLPDNYGDHICSDHFVPSDISNGKIVSQLFFTENPAVNMTTDINLHSL